MLLILMPIRRKLKTARVTSALPTVKKTSRGPDGELNHGAVFVRLSDQ